MANTAALQQMQQAKYEVEPLTVSRSEESSLKYDVSPRSTIIARWKVVRIIGLLFDVVTILFSSLFFVYGLMVRAHDGVSLDSSTARLLQKVSNLVLC